MPHKDRVLISETPERARLHNVFKFCRGHLNPTTDILSDAGLFSRSWDSAASVKPNVAWLIVITLLRLGNTGKRALFDVHEPQGSSSVPFKFEHGFGKSFQHTTADCNQSVGVHRVHRHPARRASRPFVICHYCQHLEAIKIRRVHNILARRRTIAASWIITGENGRRRKGFELRLEG